MARWTTQWFLSLYLFLIFVQGNEDADEAYKNGRNLVLEYFLPIDAPAAVDVPLRREKRDVEGSGEDDAVFSELNEKSGEDADNSTRNAFAKLLAQEGQPDSGGSLISTEGSGEIDEVSESSIVSSGEEKDDPDVLPATEEAEVSTRTESDEIPGSTISGDRSEVNAAQTSTEMIFDKSEDFVDVGVEETTTAATESTTAVISDSTTMSNNEEVKTKFAGNFTGENTTELPESEQDKHTTPTPEEIVTFTFPVNAFPSETTTESTTDATTAPSNVFFQESISENASPPPAEATTTVIYEESKEFTTPAPEEAVTLFAAGAQQENTTEESSKTVISESITSEGTTKAPEISSTKFLLPVPVPKATELPEIVRTTPEPVLEEIFKETKVHENLEASPGNILQKQNLSLAADPLLVANTRLMDSEETVQLSSSEPKRLGAYVVIGLILLSFSSLVGYITFRKRMNRKREELERNQESDDTEKALLSLSDYKDSSELEENHLKNNEITPIVVKSNAQINKFEKNTNFSSPKNLNMIANEKNIEKDNVLKSTAENLTQVIIEGSPKEMEEDKNVPSMEKLIVKTRIDQDSIPKKPIIINRSSTGYMPIPQDNAGVLVKSEAQLFVVHGHPQELCRLIKISQSKLTDEMKLLYQNQSLPTTPVGRSVRQELSLNPVSLDLEVQVSCHSEANYLGENEFHQTGNDFNASGNH